VIAQQLPQRSHRLCRRYLDRGVVAVEMEFVPSVLAFQLKGMTDCGRAQKTQVKLRSAAREGIRLASLIGTATVAGASYGDTAWRTSVARSGSAGTPTFPPNGAGPCRGGDRGFSGWSTTSSSADNYRYRRCAELWLTRQPGPELGE
jgi:hypothetical protein